MTIVVTGIISYKNGNQKAVIDAVLWSLFLVSLIPLVLKSFALFPDGFQTNLSIQIGFMILIMLTPFTVKYRISEERNENYSLQADLIENMKQSEKALREDVEEQTKEINEINMMLMDRAIELGSINQLSDKINASLNIDEVLHNACAELAKIFPVRSAGIAMLSQNRESLITRSDYSDTTDDISLRTEISLNGNTPFLDVIESHKPVMIEHMSDSAFKEYLFGSNQIEISNTVLIVPIISLREVIGTIILTAGEADYKFNKSEIDLAKTIAQQLAGSVENARLFSRTEKALGTAVNDLEIGKQIQADFFPSALEEIEGWELIPYFRAARQVSGDFYDVFPINDSGYTAFIIGDVCDKGVGAALFMVLFRSLLRAYSLKEKRYDDVKLFLEHIISGTNNYIAETHSKANMFAAIFYGIIIPDKNEIYYINGGLEAPVVLNSSGDIINKLVPTGPVVGMFPDMDFTVKSVRLNPGDILFVYTDGSTDAKNSRQELFGEEQLLKTISSPWLSGFSLLFNLNARLSRHIGKQSQYDDITQFVLRRKLFPDENKHSITRKADIDKLEELRDFVEKAVLYCGLNNNFVFAFKIVTEEICTNIIKYGYEGRDNGDIKIEFELEAETALLKIYDYGKGFVPEENQSADINENWETRKIGGLGITLVKGFMDSIDFTKDPDNGNCVLLRKKLN
jgi:sigma-B regulation protein RsbU (phosphoserine phosphatase)